MFPVWTIGENDRNLGVGFRADDVGVELDAVAHWHRDVALNKKVLVRLDSITEAGMLALFGICDALAPDHLTRVHSDRPSLVCALFVYCTCRVYSSTSLCPAIQDRAGRRIILALKLTQVDSIRPKCNSQIECILTIRNLSRHGGQLIKIGGRIRL